MGVRVTFKSLVLLAVTASFCMVIFNVSSTHRPTQRLHSRVAHITGQDLLAIRHSSEVDGVIPQPIDIPGVFSTSSHIILNASRSVPPPCGHDCHPPRNKSQETGTILLNNGRATGHQQQNNNTGKQCGRACRLNNLWKKNLIRHSMYMSRVQVENITLPGSWTVTNQLVDRLSQRQRHVQEW